jgi:hypothetical protein
MSEKVKPIVRVTLDGPDDGGDFGPNTPGTGTGGIQEALDYAHTYCRDVYIYGGRGGFQDIDMKGSNIYTLHETLRIPWSQDFRLDGGNYLLHYLPKTGDAVIVDSQMSCRFKFGLVVSNSEDGAGFHIMPHNEGPDKFSVITTTVFDFSAIVTVGEAVGILLDASQGAIVQNTILSDETNTRGIGIYLTTKGSNKGIIDNTFRVVFNQQGHASANCTNLRVGDPGVTNIRDNHFEMTLYSPRGVYLDEKLMRWIEPDGFIPPDSAMGAQIFAQNNRFDLKFYGKRSPGNDLVFEEGSRNNTVFAYNLPNGLTNRAPTSNNRVIPNWSVGFDLATPPVPGSGSVLVNTTCFLVEVMITDPGQVSAWSLFDANGTEQAFLAGLHAGQAFSLEPGEAVKLSYGKAPGWRWRALR